MPTYLGVLSITRGSGKFIIVGSKRQLLESERRPQRMGLGVVRRPMMRRILSLLIVLDVVTQQDPDSC